MTVAERKAEELESLITEHRVVRVSMQQEHAVCIARQDLPEYKISKGDTFHLFLSSYIDADGNTYAYIVNSEGCTCPSYEYRHGTCKHSTTASKLTAARYYASKSDAGELVITPIEQQLADDRAARIEAVLLPECHVCHKRYENVGNHGCALPSAEKRAAFEAVVAEVRAIENCHAEGQLAEATLIAPEVLGEQFAQDLDAHVMDGELAPWDDPAFKALSKREQAELYRTWFPNDFCNYDVA